MNYSFQSQPHSFAKSGILSEEFLYEHCDATCWAGEALLQARKDEEAEVSAAGKGR